MDLLFRHERIRPSQFELVNDMYEAISAKKNFLAHAPMGLGKTDSALSAAITHAIEEDLSVFFLTPKISQHKIAMEVVNGIATKYKLDNLRAVDLVGRSHCCIDTNLSSLDSESFHTSCTKKRRKEECVYYSNARGHNKLDEAKADARFRVVVQNYNSGKSHHEIIKEGIRKQCCPYEWLLKLSEMSNVIIADYYHLMIPQVRDVFLMKVKKRIENSIVIVDEAHNLSSRVRDSLSSTISNMTFARMEKEMRYLGLDSGPIEEEFIKWGRKTISDEDEMLLHEKDLDVFFDSFGLKIEEVREKLEETGEAFVEKTNKKSACLKIANFLSNWRERKSESARVLKKKRNKFIISKKMLDPSSATNILNQTYSSVLMSGTFEPLSMYLDILGLDPFRTELRRYKSPFNPDNSINLITPNITTKYTKRDENEFRKIANKINEISKVTPGGVAAFFCSYNMLEKVLPFLEAIVKKKLHIQMRSMKPEEIRKLIKDFKEGGILCAVQGGSLSEGIDFNQGEIKSAIIVGVALEELDVVTRALIEYYDEKFGKGWDYGYLYPSLMKALQSAGRARRKESDRATIIYMDERFRWSKYNWILNKEEKKIETSEPEREVEKFWKLSQGR